jgi:hypothetical protein
VNISKSKLFAEQIKYLAQADSITSQRIQQISNRIEAILNGDAPKTRKEDPDTSVY